MKRFHDDRDRGSVTVFVVVLIPALLLCAGLVLDGGAALSGKARAMGEAAEAARAGADAMDASTYRTTGHAVIDPKRAEQAAHAFLAQSGDDFHVTATADQVTVTVTHRQKAQLLTLLGIGELTVNGTATARPVMTPKAP